MANVYRFGKFILNIGEQTFFADGEEIHLPAKCFDLLRIFVENNGKLLSKEELMSAIWQDTFVEESNLAQYVSRLRKKLNVDGNKYISTVTKRGYRFMAETVNGDNAKVAERVLRVTFGKAEDSAASAEASGFGRLAVLPFESLGGSDNDDFLGLGFADALITQLSRVGKIVVRPTTAIKKFVGSTDDPSKIALDLGVDTLIHGSFQRSGQKWRFTIQLLSAEGGNSIWAKSFNTEVDDVFDAQDRIAELIADALQEQIPDASKHRLSLRFTENKEAYREYLRGRVQFSKRNDQGLKAALKHFERAIEIDPLFALAYTGIADVYQLLPLSDEMPPSSAFPKAKAAALRALELDDTIPESHISLGVCLMNYDWNFQGAEMSFMRAIDLNPNFAQARVVLGTLLMRLGRFGDAMIELNRAGELDPLSPTINTWIAEALSDLGEFDAAIRIHNETIRFAPEYSLAHYFLILTYLRCGRYAEAEKSVANALLVSDDVSLIRSASIVTGAFNAKIDEATAEIDKLIAQKQTKYLSATNIASGFAGLKNADEAIRWLEVALTERDSHLTWLNCDFEFEFLRSDPRFRRILERVNLPF